MSKARTLEKKTDLIETKELFHIIQLLKLKRAEADPNERSTDLESVEFEQCF
jgi:hypothetical protein